MKLNIFKDLAWVQYTKNRSIYVILFFFKTNNDRTWTNFKIFNSYSFIKNK